jgi:Protein of unknown function (DUF1524)
MLETFKFCSRPAGDSGTSCCFVVLRRMLVRATRKGYNQAVAELVRIVRSSPREKVGDVIEQYIAAQSGDSRYRPDDTELRNELSELLVSAPAAGTTQDGSRRHRGSFTQLARDQGTGSGGERVARGKLAIEHVMPRKWLAHWKPDPVDTAEQRDKLVHTLGNLTLLPAGGTAVCPTVHGLDAEQAQWSAGS